MTSSHLLFFCYSEVIRYSISAMATAATAQPSSPIHSAPNPSAPSQSQSQPNPNAANAQPTNARSTVVNTYGAISTANAAVTPGSTSSIAGTTSGSAAGSTTGSTCDNCHRRKSRCAMNEMVNKCYSCDFHRQDCTFTLSDPNPSQKRKIEDPSTVDDQSTKRYICSYFSPGQRNSFCLFV